MTARNLYEGVLIELNKENAPNILLEDFNYFANKAINNYINKRYNIYDINQQTTDDLRVLKATALLPVQQVEDYKGMTMAGDNKMATYEAVMPSDYLHILNCICIYKVEKTYKCYNKGDTWRSPATRLTADMYSQVLDNFWNKPTYKKPYYYIHNVNSSNLVPTNPYGGQRKIPIVGNSKLTRQEERTREVTKTREEEITETITLYLNYTFLTIGDSPVLYLFARRNTNTSEEGYDSNSFTLLYYITNSDTILTFNEDTVEFDSALSYEIIGSKPISALNSGLNFTFTTLIYPSTTEVSTVNINISQIDISKIKHVNSESNISAMLLTEQVETTHTVQTPYTETETYYVDVPIEDGSSIKEYKLDVGTDVNKLSNFSKPFSSEHNKYLNNTNYGTDAYGNDIVLGEGLPNTIDIFDKTTGEMKPVSNIERGLAIRYGNVSLVRLEIRYGTDNTVFELTNVYVDYIKAPQNIRLTQQEVDLTEDTSQMLEYPDYVCQEIINELVHLVMENISDLRLQTHPVVTLSIANPTQALTPAQGLSAQ